MDALTIENDTPPMACPSSQLAAAVILQALDDLKHPHLAHELRHWVDTRNFDFYCTAAGLSDAARHKLEHALRSGQPAIKTRGAARLALVSKT